MMMAPGSATAPRFRSLTIGLGVALALAVAVLICLRIGDARLAACRAASEGADHDSTIELCSLALNTPLFSPQRQAIALSQRSLAYDLKQDYAQALANAERTVALAPAAAFPRWYRGIAAADTGDYARALADFTYLVEQGWIDAATYWRRAGAYYKLRQYDQAIADYDEVIRQQPANQDVIFWRVRAYDDKGDRDHAIAGYTDAIRLNAQDSQATYFRGYLYYTGGDDDRAIADLSETVRLSPDAFRGHFWLARSLDRKGDHAAAIASYDKAIALQPTYTDALIWRARAFRNKGDMDRAINEDQHAVESAPLNAAVLDRLALDLAFFGRAKDGLSLSYRAVALDANNPTYWLHEGYVLAQLQRWPEAIKAVANSLTASIAASKAGESGPLADIFFLHGYILEQQQKQKLADGDYAAARQADPEIDKLMAAWGVVPGNPEIKLQ